LGIPVFQASRTAALPTTGTATPTRTRWIILFLISLMYLICYMDRSNITVAQVEIAGQLGLSRTAMALVFSAFTWAYAIGQIPAGFLGDRFGPKKVLLVIMPWWAIAAAMTGGAFGLGSLFTARFLLGLGEAGAFPVASRGMQLWFPRAERGRIQGITHFFSRFAVAITPFVAAMIMLAFGWHAIFYIFGSLGILWSAAFYFYYRNQPEEHSGVNQAELAQIRGRDADGSIRQVVAARPAIPWKTILSSSNMWAIAAAYGCFFYGTYFFLSWYPTYLREYRHVTLQALGLVGSLPLFAGMAGDVVGGGLTDFLFRRTGNAKLARRAVAAPAMLVSGLFLIPAATTRDTWTCILCLAASFFLLEWVIGPAWAVPMDVGGQFSGSVTGIMNMAGALGASLTPLVFGYFIERGSWIAPFFVTTGVMAAGTLIWTFFINPEKSVVTNDNV
jgi:sugar phosphate permease